jgi:hypothetical protein
VLEPVAVQELAQVQVRGPEPALVLERVQVAVLILAL